MKFSPELAAFIGKKVGTRAEALKIVLDYVKEKKLQDDNEKFIFPDKKISRIFGTKRKRITKAFIKARLTAHFSSENTKKSVKCDKRRHGPTGENSSGSTSKEPQPKKITKKMKCSPELAALIGKEVCRSHKEAFKLVLAYVKEHNLQDPDDYEQFIFPDEKMSKIFSTTRTTGKSRSSNYCITEEFINAHLTTHLQEFTPENGQRQKNFVCDYCDMKFYSKLSAELHMKSVMDEGGKYKCKLCDFKSCKVTGLSIHIESGCQSKESIPSQKPVKSVRKNESKVMDRPHSLSKPTLPTQKLSTDRPRLSWGSSGINFDPNTKHYNCQKCAITFETRAEGLKHASKEHNIQIQFPCDNCDMKFFSKQSLKLHMKSVKDEGGKHKCKLCNFKSCKKTGLAIHIESHP